MSALQSTGITTSLVGTTLGTSSRDVGALCSHQSVNMWSKHKPVRFPTLEGLTLQQLVQANFGFDIRAVEAFVPTAAMLRRAWGYNRPRGGVSEPFRLGDFREYSHTEGPPMFLRDELLSVPLNVFIPDGIDFGVTPTYRTGGQWQAGSGGNVRLNIEDLNTTGLYNRLNELFFCLGVFANGALHWVSAESPLSAGVMGGAGISSIAGSDLQTFLTNAPNNTDIEVFPFLSTARRSESSHPHHMVPLPRLQPIIVRKDSRFWQQIENSSITISGRQHAPTEWSANIGYRTRLTEHLRATIAGMDDHELITTSLSVRIRPLAGRNDCGFLDLPQVRIRFMNSASHLLIHNMVIEGFVTNLGWSGVHQTIQHNGRAFFTPNLPTDVQLIEYVARFNFSAVRLDTFDLKANAVANINIPGNGQHEVNAGFEYNLQNVPFSPNIDLGYRFN